MTRISPTVEPRIAARQSWTGLRTGVGGVSTPAVLLAALLGAVLWSYWPVIWGLWREWQRNPNYSVGELVPPAALYLLWHERHRLRGVPAAACWWGLVPLLLAEVVRGLGLLFLYESAERYGLVLAIVAVVLLAAGPALLWRVRWILAFLVLMVPLPGRVHNLISGPLQDWATTGTVFVLELAGTYVVREGNVLSLNNHGPIGIEEACSGLRMLTAFVVVAAFFVLTVQRPTWQRVSLLVSSVPIALICNVARVVATVALFLYVGGDAAERFVHDFAGIAMMPLAVALLVAELWLLDHIVSRPASPQREVVAAQR